MDRDYRSWASKMIKRLKEQNIERRKRFSCAAGSRHTLERMTMTDETTNTEQSRVAADCPNERGVMPEFSQGVCQDGAAIFMDGKPLTIEEILAKLRSGAEAERIVGEVWDMFYGQNMLVANWHLNGDLEPIDSFFEENDWAIEEA